MSSPSGPIQKKARHGDANAAATAVCLPEDVLASILVRLPASDLRRFRRVCNEWRKIISNPAFIDDHMVHGPRTLTHTIVFFPGQPCGVKYSDSGTGFLVDGQQRLTATFSAPRFDEMIGQSNGLLCFLDGCYDNLAMYVVDPFSGESLTLPRAPQTSQWRDHAAYCFGFDPSSRKFKIFHQGQSYNIEKPDLYVYTIGGDESWRMVQVAGEKVLGVHHGDPVLADGSVYWSVVTTGQLTRLARFDLATEEATTLESIDFLPDSEARARVMTTVRPHGRHLARPHGLPGLNNCDDCGGRAIAPATDDLGCGELLLEASVKKKRPASGGTRGLFVPVPVQVNQKSAAVARRTRDKDRRARVFCYAPPVSPAPLARYFGKL